MSRLAGIYAQTPINRSQIPQSELNIVNKYRSNPLRWNGQFSPQLVQVLLKKYTTESTILFDPFLGSGTVLLEAGLIGRKASGSEINPAAVTLAQTYHFINVPVDCRRFHLNLVSQLLQRNFSPPLPLFQNLAHGYDEQDSELLNLYLATSDPLQCKLLESLMVLLDFYKPSLSRDKLFAEWKKLTRVLLELPFSEQPIEIFHTDARQTPLPDSSVDLVITSPPYLNVFNYHQQYRVSMEALNWNLLTVAKSEIGSNRKHRGNRFLTVIQFCLDMAQTLSELMRVCQPNARLIFVVGRESKVRGTVFFNGEIVTEIAHRALGFNLILKQERVFQNRFGNRIFEDILHFSPPVNKSYDHEEFLHIARTIAQDVLQSAYPETPNKAKEGIKSALNKIDDVYPSPLFNLQNALQKHKRGLNARDPDDSW